MLLSNKSLWYLDFFYVYFGVGTSACLYEHNDILTIVYFEKQFKVFCTVVFFCLVVPSSNHSGNYW